jgi:hypothetical protein
MITCVHRKPKPGRCGDKVRRIVRVNFRNGRAKLIELLYSTSDFWLVVQNHVQQGAVDFNLLVVVFDKAQFPKFVHEEIHAAPGRFDHLRKCFLADFCYDWLRPTFLAKIRQKQKDPCQPLLARIKQLINQILFGFELGGAR